MKTSVKALLVDSILNSLNWPHDNHMVDIKDNY